MNRALDVAIAGARARRREPAPRGSPRSRSSSRTADRCSTGRRASGKDGVDFELLKLRTMIVGAEKQGAGYAVDQGDSRITRVGRVLRRLSRRRAAAALERRARRDGGDRAAADAPLPGRALRRAPAAPPRRASRASPAGRRSTAARRCRGPSGSSSTSGTSRHHDWKTDLLILLRTPLALFGGTYKGKTGGWHGLHRAARYPAPP